MRHKPFVFLNILVKNNINARSFCRTSVISNVNKVQSRPRKINTENNFIYLEDPDTFGTLSTNSSIHLKVPEDEGDLAEENYLQNVPLPSQKLTTKQYADLIKQYVKHKRIKEAINVLEERMLIQDRVKPENYIYNLLIGACAEVGYTKKAFKLYNDMKRRALKVTGDTYTCLFNACANSPWSNDGLKNAKHLRQLMLEKQIEPNLTNYNAMIKAFGRCGDLSTAFQLVDEMRSKRIKIRVHTFNFLLQACITDKHSGLRHALIIWRKMLSMKEKPNIYSFNLMLKCVKECNLGSKEDVQHLLEDIKKSTVIKKGQVLLDDKRNNKILHDTNEMKINEGCSEVTSIEKVDDLPLELKIPNLISKDIKIQNVMSMQEVHTLQDKFALVGKEVYFLKEMQVYSVPPNMKTFTQMLFLLDDCSEAEDRLIKIIKAFNIRTDIDFYNMLIKKRCLRRDYIGAFEVKKMINEESDLRKKKYPLKKKLKLKPNVMTYGVLAMACDTKGRAEELLMEMKEQRLKINIEIMGALLRQATCHKNFEYILFVMNTVKEEKLRINSIFMKHLIDFNEKCEYMLQPSDDGKQKCKRSFIQMHSVYERAYLKWLKEVDSEESLKEEHPWKQFMCEQPEPVQRQLLIEEPKRFYKRKYKFVAPYRPRL